MDNIPAEVLATLSPDNPIFTILERLQKLEDKMAAHDPEISSHMSVIHKTLGEYEELAHLLTPQQIGVLMRGMQKHAAISLVLEDKRRPSKSKKVGVSDLI